MTVNAELTKKEIWCHPVEITLAHKRHSTFVEQILYRNGLYVMFVSILKTFKEKPHQNVDIGYFCDRIAVQLFKEEHEFIIFI